MPMSDLILLEKIQLIPVVELAPYYFAKEERQLPNATGSDNPDSWSLYCQASLADAGIRELRPIHDGSWFVPITNFDRAENLWHYLRVTIEGWGGLECLQDPDANPVL